MTMSNRFGEQYTQVVSSPHKAKLSVELVADAACYRAIKAYNAHCEREGKPVEHTKAKELLGGFAGDALDSIVETKDLDVIDKRKVRQYAEEVLNDEYDQYYELY
ncbi:uncharacterized protein BX664DRAFT_385395 [Halteromyces radiatus]|uniref:uncharacterized protein n=1 Tax=Halteromyces radiatus TaxID=101107 RepID=UPI00221FC1FD|nr:uncharacterized protein BX664DRAFT_385395 [Halteromyces radiatus]KAI8088792.1 hypothetical protein BX664DRAFT_385395 [Halteromyces radiatus]